MEYYSKPKNTISYTCDWYDKYSKKSEMKLFSINQIKKFYKLAEKKIK